MGKMETERIKIKEAVKYMETIEKDKFIDEIIKEMFDAEFISPMLNKILGLQKKQSSE